MTASQTQLRHEDNRLLASLSGFEQERLLPLMPIVKLRRKQTLHLSGDSLRLVYFPITAIFSVVSVLQDGTSTEVGLVGNEGMAGLPAFLGAPSDPFEIVVHVEGTAYRVSADRLREAAHKSDHLQALLLRYAQSFMNQLAQGTACRGHHLVRQRLARLLLMIRDGSSADRFPMTHEYLGQMLGVGRPSVTIAAASLRDSKLITYNRGGIIITDGPGLEDAACECYRIVRDEYDRLLH
jgi:CRP-like cAMP-binding protein